MVLCCGKEKKNQIQSTKKQSTMRWVESGWMWVERRFFEIIKKNEKTKKQKKKREKKRGFSAGFDWQQKHYKYNIIKNC
jgi:hypothetical protein